MNEAMKSSCEKLMTAVNALAVQTGESPESIVDWLADNGGLTNFILSYFSGQQTVRDSLTVQAHPSCEPVGYFAQLGTGEFIQLLDPQDRAEVTALYAALPGYEALRAENAKLKQDLVDAILLKDGYLQEYRDLESVSEVQLEGLRSENLHLKTEREKLQQLLMTTLDAGRAAIAERNALKARNDELVSEITKALSYVECSHRPPVKDSLEIGRMVHIRLHSLADLHAIISKEQK
jgi:hypothetical protein